MSPSPRISLALLLALATIAGLLAEGAVFDPVARFGWKLDRVFPHGSLPTWGRWLPGIRSRSGCAQGTKLSHAAAMAMCTAAGIGIRSTTGKIGCRDPGCTSLEQVRCETVLGIVAFKRACGCSGMVITGGTEMGHSSGTYSHYNGYKLDIALTQCISGYVTANFRYSRTRRDGAMVYVDGRSNEYAREKYHWDILYR